MSPDTSKGNGVGSEVNGFPELSRSRGPASPLSSQRGTLARVSWECSCSKAPRESLLESGARGAVRAVLGQEVGGWALTSHQQELTQDKAVGATVENAESV